jgi:5-methyltetrahydrofolate--homocysteine methyltransferase
MFLIGELINSTRKRIRTAVESHDAAYIQDVARRQAEAGAQMLDVNGGIPGREAEVLCWLVNTVQQVTDLPLCLDSSDPEALRRALPLCKQRPMINSINDEPERFNAVLPLVKEFGAKVIALAMGPAGPPSSLEDRLATASRLVDRLTAAGIAPDDIYVDPCVLPVSTGSQHGYFVAETISQIRSRYPGVHTSVGLSNVSFGLPCRKLLNEVFLVLLMSRGLDAVIADPCDRWLMACIYAAEALLGQDEFCVEYLRAYREGKLEPPVEPAPTAR